MATHGNRRATSFTLVASVDLGDPTYLAFGYVRRLATVLRLAAPAAVPSKVLRLGGGALTLPRECAPRRATLSALR
jgi:hypothetical protein